MRYPIIELEDQLAVFTTRLSSVPRHSPVYGQIDRFGFVVASALSENGPSTTDELAGLLSLERPTITRQLATLTGRGFVAGALCPGRPDATVFDLTPSGKAELQRVNSGRSRQIADLVGDWNQRDIRTFADLLGRFNQSIMQRGDGDPAH